MYSGAKVAPYYYSIEEPNMATLGRSTGYLMDAPIVLTMTCSRRGRGANRIETKLNPKGGVHGALRLTELSVFFQDDAESGPIRFAHQYTILRSGGLWSTAICFVALELG